MKILIKVEVHDDYRNDVTHCRCVVETMGWEKEQMEIFEKEKSHITTT